MSQWKKIIRRALGIKSPVPAYILFSDLEWKDYSENPYRVVYMLQMKQGVKKSALYDFLIQEWLPALKESQGCIGVEIANDFASGSGYVLLEFWETKNIYDEAIPQLWNGTHKHTFEKLKELAAFAFLWEGIVVDRYLK